MSSTRVPSGEHFQQYQRQIQQQQRQLNEQRSQGVLPDCASRELPDKEHQQAREDTRGAQAGDASNQ